MADNESKLGGVEMHPGFDKYMMQLRKESKEQENQGKPPITSPDVVQTADFVFSQIPHQEGDSGRLLLAKRKVDRNDRYLVKHAYTDCACNEFIYTKLAQAMGYCMPDAVLFQLSPGEKRPYFKTEYIIGERYLHVTDSMPTYEKVREQAKNWEHYFSFYGLYSLTGEGDGVEILLADDDRIYRVDTADAFPISNFQLDMAGIHQSIRGLNPQQAIKQQLLSSDMSQVLDPSWCNINLASCLKICSDSLPYFLDPFARIQDIRSDYIDDFLNTLCYFYPDFIGDYFKRYISALQKQCAEYWKEKR